MALPDHRAFSSGYNKLSIDLRTPIKITHKFDPEVSPVTLGEGLNLRSFSNRQENEFIALWDTGATNTCISKAVVKKLALKPITVARVSGAYGEENTKPVYLVCLYLPNGVFFDNTPVIEWDSQDIEVLVGMDILTKGDFAVSNVDNKTFFSFRIPSLEKIDFLQTQREQVKGIPKSFPEVGRNDPCSCGSGKKYKKCHGK